MENDFVATHAGEKDENLCVYSTMDYAQFKTVLGNRELSEANVEKIKASMKKEHLRVPAIINKYGEVCDGQHRLRASRELDIPFYYIIVPNYGLHEVQEINANQKNWTNYDFLQSFVKRNDEEPANFRDYVRLSEILAEQRGTASLTTLLTIVYEGSTSQTVTDNFRAGKMVLQSREDILEILEELEAIHKYLPTRAYTRSFVAVYMALGDFETFEFSTLLDQLSNHANLCKEIDETGNISAIYTKTMKAYNDKLPRKRVIFTEAVGYALKDKKNIQWA